MPGFVDTVIESLKQTLSWPLLIYFFAVQLLEAFAIGLVFVFFALIAVLSVFGLIGQTGIPQLVAFFSNPANLVGIIGLFLVVMFFFFLVAMYVSAFFTGMRFNLFNNFLKEKRLDLGRAFSQTKGRAFTYFKIDLLITIILTVLFGLIWLLAFIPLLPLMLGQSSLSAVGPLVMGLILALIFMLLLFIVLLLVSPVLVLLAPVAFFEKEGVIGSIKRSIALVKVNYWGNLAFLIVYVIIITVISLVVQFILGAIRLVFFLPFALVSDPMNSALIANLVGSIALFSIIAVIILVPFIVWSSAFQTASFRNLHALNVSLSGKVGTGPKRRPGRKTK